MRSKSTLIAGCLAALMAGPATAQLPADFDRSGQQLLITIYYAKNKQQLDQLVMQHKKRQLDPRQSGAAYWSNSDNVCQVFVIKPKRDAAYEMAPVGHEVHHCVTGSFH